MGGLCVQTFSGRLGDDGIYFTVSERSVPLCLRSDVRTRSGILTVQCIGDPRSHKGSVLSVQIVSTLVTIGGGTPSGLPPL